jgi:hypothetical protein
MVGYARSSQRFSRKPVPRQFSRTAGYAAFDSGPGHWQTGLTMIDLAPSPFELAAAELRRLDLDLTRLPGEYRVNFHNGAESTAQIAETVDAALDLGRIMAAGRAEAHTHSAGPRRRRRPRRMTPKAYNKRLRMAQQRRLARRIRRQPAGRL